MIEVRQPDARNLIRCITFAWLCSYALKSRNNSAALAFQSVRHTNCAKAQDSRSHLRGRIHLCASVQNEISDQIRSGSVPGTTCGIRTTPKAVQTSMGSTRISFIASWQLTIYPGWAQSTLALQPLRGSGQSLNHKGDVCSCVCCMSESRLAM